MQLNWEPEFLGSGPSGATRKLCDSGASVSLLISVFFLKTWACTKSKKYTLGHSHRSSKSCEKSTPHILGVIWKCPWGPLLDTIWIPVWTVSSHYLLLDGCLRGGNNHTAHQALITKSSQPFWKRVILWLSHLEIWGWKADNGHPTWHSSACSLNVKWPCFLNSRKCPEMVIILKVLPHLWLNVVLDEEPSLTIRNDPLPELRHPDLAVTVA